MILISYILGVNKMKNKFLVLSIIVLTVCIFTAGAAFASSGIIKIIVNGKEVQSKVQPLLADDTVMVPIRVISETLGANVAWDEENNSVLINTKDKIYKTVATIPDEGITLTAADIDWTYQNFYLQVNKSKRYFDWKNVENPSYAPKLSMMDINNDGQKELIVILITGYGTGVCISEAHVIDPITLNEVYVDNPNIVVLKNVKTNITENEIEISTGDNKTVISRDKLNIESGYNVSAVGFGAICNFEVIDGKLIVTMHGQISPTCFIGELKITYEFKDNMYQAANIEFSENYY
jgi:Copper amine oxidase N-terminal domain.